MDELNQLTVPAASAATQPLWRTIFWGPHGIRAGWSVAIFAAIVAGEMSGIRLLDALQAHGGRSAQPTSISWLDGLAMEGFNLVLLAIAVWIMSRIEDKPITAYGYRGPASVSAGRFVYGLLWGFAAISGLVLALWRLGYLAFDGDVLAASRAWKYALAWALVFMVVALFEESFLRGYLQATLTRGLGFWWGALLLSIGFGFMHGSNPGESPVGLLAAGAVGLVFCLSLWYTGSLWWAIGFHAAWDWGESFFYGTADSGMVAQGHLLTEHPIGILYWSGGTTGPEGSILSLAVLALSAGAMILWWGKRTTSPFAGYGWRPPRGAQSLAAEPVANPFTFAAEPQSPPPAAHSNPQSTY